MSENGKYAANDFGAAYDTLMKAEQVSHTDSDRHHFILSKTLWQLGHHDQALSQYAEGAAWMAAL